MTTVIDNRRWAWLLLLLLLASGLEFALRGPIRLIRTGTEWNDFLSPYIQARVWTKGMNPYSPGNFVLQWPSNKAQLASVMEDAAKGTLIQKRGVPSPYPLTSFVVLAPIALLPWYAAQTVWMTLNLAAFGLMLRAMLSLTGAQLRDPHSQMFLGLALALAPFHTGLATENPAVIVVAICSIAAWAERRDRHKSAGILLGVAVCLKPQVGLCFLLYCLIRRRWKTLGIAGSWIALISFIAISRLALSGTPWLSSYIETNRSIFSSGAINDFTSANPVWYNLINLQVGFSALGVDARNANVVASLCGAILFFTWLWLCTRKPPSEILEISALVLLSLLPVYHRFYDAALLVWPLGWCVLAPRDHSRYIPRLVLVCILPFLVPGAAFLNQMAESGRIPDVLVRGWWWNALVVAHQSWLLLGLSLFLLAAMKSTHSTNQLPQHRARC